MILAAAEGLGRHYTTTREDTTAAMHADDARHLYVDVAAPLAAGTVLTMRGCGEGDEAAFRASRAESPARSVKEAGGELERLVRSGFRTRRLRQPGRGRRSRCSLDASTPPCSTATASRPSRA